MTEQKQTSIALYNQLLLKILKCDLSADRKSHHGGYLSLIRMKEILLEAIMEVDPISSYYAVVTGIDEQNRSYVTIQIVMAGEEIKTVPRQYYPDHQDYKKLLTEQNMAAAIGKIEPLISMSLSYATRRLFSTFFGMHEEDDKKLINKEVPIHVKPTVRNN